MRWFVTGGCGFIGRALIQSLVERGETVRVYDNLSVGTRGELAGVAPFVEVESPQSMEDSTGLELVVGDILDEPSVRSSVRGADVIVHLAANTGVGPSVENPGSDCRTNVLGTLAILESARHRGVKRVVFASSGAPLGECEPPLHERLAPRPASPYGASKLAGEGYCSAYFHSFGVETVALRFGNVYGPGSMHKGSVVAKFIRQSLSGEEWEVYGDGNQTRDFVYVADLVDAIQRAGTTPGVGGEVFQIATNAETTVNQLIAVMQQVLGEMGAPAGRVLHTATRTGDVLRNYSDTSKAREQLGWQAEHSLREGIAKTIAWFLSSPAAKAA